MTRWTSLAAALAVLSACTAAGGGVTGAIVGECAKVDDKALKYINWARVPEVEIRIRNGEFSPMVVRLRQGWPYVLKIRNRDHQERTFKAGEFFQRVAMIKATVAGKDEDLTCLSAVVVPARQTAELKLVAVTDGYYEYEDTLLPIPGLFSTAPNGVIIIEERKTRI